MSASRDDFIIAIRSALLKRENKQRFSLIGLIFFSIILIILSRFNFQSINLVKNGINEIIYRVSFIVSIPEKQFQKSVDIIKNHILMYENYDILKNKFTILENKKITNQFLIEENKRLRKLIDEYILVSDELVAKVLLDKNSPFLKSIIVNKGSKDKVKIGMAVLDNNYLVGKIVEVNYSTSRALLVSDLNSKIPIIIEPGNIQSILSGTGKNSGIIQYIKDDKILKENSVIFTSGSGGIFKAGIPIGKLLNSSDQSNKEVEYFSDLSQLTFVKLALFEEENKWAFQQKNLF